jgi:Chaperone of endosialidase
VPPAPGVTVNSVTSTSIVDGSIGAADINTAQVQRRLTGECPRGQYMTYIYADGAPICTPVVGVSNTALGLFALQSVLGVSGNNTAIGNAALRDLSTGNNNTAVGQGAMLQTTVGQQNVAVGGTAMAGNLTGFSNVVVGQSALGASTSGAQNVVIGALAMQSATASNNIAIGYQAGANVTSGTNNILIGSAGVAGDSNRLRLGTSGSQTAAFIAGVRGVTVPTGIPVIIGTDGQLGTTTSSRRFKQDIADMGGFSARLAALRPVTFRYTQPAADGSRPLDFGFIAEEVAEVFPELAVRSADGTIETVAYHKLPVLLLNELQQQQRTLDALLLEVAALRAALASAPKR